MRDNGEHDPGQRNRMSGTAEIHRGREACGRRGTVEAAAQLEELTDHISGFMSLSSEDPGKGHSRACASERSLRILGGRMDWCGVMQ